MSTSADKAELDQFVTEVEQGGRSVTGVVGLLVLLTAIAWSLFQLWYASPLPFSLSFGIFNDTEARSIHLGIAMFLAYLVYPARSRSPRDRIPIQDWVLAFIAGFCGAYLFLFYRELAQRPGIPTQTDIIVASIGLILLLEATRRALGAPMAILGIIVISYVFLGPWLPEALAHRGASLQRLMSHMWLTTEGVYGVALGVSASYIFIFVLLGSLLDRCGTGNYLMQLSFALLGHLRGGPAKVAVASSAVNGVVSASSVANVVTTGIFTIPLMKKAGYGGVRAGAIETASSVNGQIMPPVMGAAAFLMIEYVGIQYTEIIRHAFLPAIISYIALFYIVHLEALKLGIEPMMSAGRPKTALQRLTGWALGICTILIVVGIIYWVGIGVQLFAGSAAFGILLFLMLALYIVLLRLSAKYDDLPTEIDVSNPVRPDTWPTVRSGLYFLIPIGVLVWCLTVEMLSPGLSAFWAVSAILFQTLTHRPIIAWFRKQDALALLPGSVRDVFEGLAQGARNMIGIGIACGTAGLIVGAITLTGLGLRMTSFVEIISMGSVLAMLFFTAVVCLILGLGMPTTANYILMATLMAPVVVELGAQNGMIIPLIAVHMFVFYYGIMADITPPVGLATFAAAAISGEDPIKTGIQGVTYAMRTAILPFMFIFNPMLLLIGLHSISDFIFVVVGATLASLSFAAASMRWMRVRATTPEVILLLLVTFMLFRPDWLMNRVYDRYVQRPAAELMQVVEHLPDGANLVLQISGMNIEGDELSKTVAVSLPGLPEGDESTGLAAANKRLSAAGISIMAFGQTAQIASVSFGSAARRSGWEQGWDIESVQVRNPDRPSDFLVYLPALLILLWIWVRQGVRLRRETPPSVVAA